jgi:integrase
VQINIRYKEVRVRRQNSHLFEGEEKFTGGKTYQVVGTYNHKDVRLSLGTEEKNVAIRRITKIESAVHAGADSLLWHELAETLPAKTLAFFAEPIGFKTSAQKLSSTATWRDLAQAFEIDMQRRVDNKLRGASAEEGVMSESTRMRYRFLLKQFGDFLGTRMPLAEITPATIVKFKNARFAAITGKKQSRGGSSVALDIAILHQIFSLAVKLKLESRFVNPIDLAKESKPGKNPKNGARSFTSEELVRLRSSLIWKHKGQKPIDDSLVFLLLRWTGLRRSDAIRLRWEHVRFSQGDNGEIEIMTQKRGKLAVIPLSGELRQALEEERRKTSRQASLGVDDYVLLNPATSEPFTSATRLTERCKALGDRAGVKRCTPHCFRDTFACDMLARGSGIYDVAKMLADAVETVEEYYAEFVPKARNAAQNLMDNGVGIEEQGEIANQRKEKIVAIRGFRKGR